MPTSIPLSRVRPIRTAAAALGRVGIVAGLAVVGIALAGIDHAGLGIREAAAQSATKAPPPDQRCEVYQQTFDKGRAKLEGKPEAARALRLRRLGERLCNTGRTVEGQQVLREAITASGKKPPAVPIPSDPLGGKAGQKARASKPALQKPPGR